MDPQIGTCWRLVLVHTAHAGEVATRGELVMLCR